VMYNGMPCDQIQDQGHEAAEPGCQTHSDAIISPKFANLLKFYPRAQNVHAMSL